MKLLRNTALSLFLLAGIGNIAHSAPIIQDTSNNFYQIEFFSPLGQSFAAEDAFVNSIGFVFNTLNPDYGYSPITVTLYEGSGFGGSVLGSTQISPLAGSTGAYYDALFPGIQVVLGQTYTAGVSTGNPYWGIDINEGGNPYSGGTAFYTNIFNNLAPELDDLRFRVNVVPEPETYAMLLAGLGLLGAIARRGKTSK